MLLFELGSAFHVWTTALMFFQGALLLAYLYAHHVAERIGRGHLLLIALGLFWLPPTLHTLLGGDSVPAIVLLLLVSVGVPFVALASSAVVAQRWLARGGVEPYSLYAWSNAGSLAGLFGYSLWLDPWVDESAQRWVWAIGFVTYLGLAIVAWRARPPAAREPGWRETWTEPPPRRQLVYWGLLSAAPSAFLLGVTNLIALDVGHAPLVWAVPLAIYLGSFVWAFARPVPGLVRRLWPHVALVGLYFFSGGDAGDGWLEAVVQLVVLAFVTLGAHGELYRTRPATLRLGTFYEVVALGGWLGGAAVALLAPRLFGGLWEYPAALGLLGLTMAWGRREELRAWLRTRPLGPLLASGALLAVIAFKVGAGLGQEGASETLAAERSFHGLYRVTRTATPEGAVRDLVSGDTRHGRQREGDGTPLSYYHPAGPLGDVWRLVRPRAIGVVGLGVGAAAGYLERDDQRMRFFEIDPAVERLARAHFSFLARGGDRVEVVLGDARRSLEAERAAGAPGYDLLLVDAFAGDAVPAHLLTVEAVALDLSRLRPDGVALFHVSNRYYALRPVLRAAAEALGVWGVHVARRDGLARDEDPSEYVALSRDPARLRPLLGEGWLALDEGLPHATAWTDERPQSLRALRAR